VNKTCSLQGLQYQRPAWRATIGARCGAAFVPERPENSPDYEKPTRSPSPPETHETQLERAQAPRSPNH